MSPPTRYRPHGPDHGPYEPVSDTWLLVDAIITILTALLTIVVLVMRHPFTVLGGFIVMGVVGAIADWW